MRIGIDLGGTKIAGVMLGADGSTVAAQRVATPREDYHGTVAALVGLVAELRRLAGEIGGSVGIGTPGAVRLADGRMKNCNSTWLNGQFLSDDLTEALGQPVRIANDADCMALSEAVDGAGAGAHSIFGVILGTGVGGGLVVDGQLVRGPSRTTGEWGHAPLPQFRDDPLGTLAVETLLADRLCYCGKRNCIERFVSGPGLAQTYREVTGEALNSAAIVARSEAGEDNARRVIESYERLLARSLSLLINIVDPEVIVAGGGLSNVARLYQNVATLLPHYVFGGEAQTRFVAARHGDATGVRGAAWLWNDNDE